MLVNVIGKTSEPLDTGGFEQKFTDLDEEETDGLCGCPELSRIPHVIEISREMSKGGSGGGEAVRDCATAEAWDPGMTLTPGTKLKWQGIERRLQAQERDAPLPYF